MTAWWCAHAWLPEGPARAVRLVAGADGTFASVTPGVAAAPGDTRLPGLVLPGLADAHSHAFHRALRGRTSGGAGDFWTWRRAMYAVAERLDPDGLLELATLAYAEQALAGFASVAEFHYLHHGPRGVPYDDPNAMAGALREAARRAGVRLTLLDACYLTGGIGRPLEGVQDRFGDGSAAGWAQRVGALGEDEAFRVGAAVHSVRAVPADQIATVAAARPHRPLHAHVAEQPAEVAECRAAYGVTPVRLLAERGALGPHTTAVHATHLEPADVTALAGSGAGACVCPTTERDLGDGIGPARTLHDAGVALSLGTDQHVVVDGFEEIRGLEGHERLASGRRGRFAVAELVAALTVHGAAAAGWPEAGRLAPGAPADLVAVRLDSVRTAGAAPEQAVLAATAADVDTVVVAGRAVVAGGEHLIVGDVGRRLAAAVERLWP